MEQDGPSHAVQLKVMLESDAHTLQVSIPQGLRMKPGLLKQ